MLTVAVASVASRVEAGVADTLRSSTVRGTVVDSETGAPVAGAQVRLVELERRVETHASGRFTFADVPAGTYTLAVRRIGYDGAAQSVTVSTESIVEITVSLTTAAIELPGIMVTGGLRAQESEYALQPSVALDGRDLDRNLGATLAETVAHETGIAAVSMGPATARPIIRGLGGDRVLLLEDGARTGDMSYSAPDHAVSVDPFSAERIEVVRGPAALLYGSNALSGVVNIRRDEIPTTVPDGVHGRVGLQAQSASRSATAGGHLIAPLGGLAVRLEGTVRDADDLRTPDGLLENTQLRTYTAAAGVGLVRDWGHGGLSYRHYNSSYGIPGGFVGGHAAGVTVAMRRNAFRGELHRRGGGGLLSDLELSGGFVHYAHEEIERGGVLGTAFRLVTADGNVIARHDGWGPFSSGGVGVRVQYQDYAFGASLATPDTRELTAAAFFLEQIETGRLRVQFGGRYDWTRIEPLDTTTRVDIGDVRARTFGVFSGSVGALVDMGGGVGVGVNLGRAFRTPDVNDLYSQGPHLAAYREEVGNPDLKMEAGVGLDAFVRVTRPGLRGELAAFRNRISNFIYPRETGDTSQRALPIAQYVGRDAELVGLEGRLDVSPLRHLAVTLTGSYVRGTLTETDQPLPLIPPLKGQIELRYERPSYFVGVGTRLAARQDRVGEFETPTPGYAVVHATAGYTWPWLGRLHAVTLRLDNLGDAVYREHLSRVKSIMPEAGRNLSALYRVDF